MTLVPIALTLLIALGAATAQGADKAQQGKLDALKTQISDLQKQLLNTGGERESLMTALRDAELRAVAIRQRVAHLETQVKALESELKTLEAQRAALQDVHDRQAQQIATEIRSVYRLGRQEPVKLLLNMENPELVSRTIKYYRYFVAARSEKLARYQDTLTELNGVKITINSRQAQLDDDRQHLVQEQETLKNQQQERRILLTKIDLQLKDDNARLAQLTRERQQLEVVINNLAQSLRQLDIPDNQPFAKQRGKLPWPLSGQVVHAFGARRAASLNWTGWLLHAAEGSPVSAVHHGRVVFSDYLRGQGLLLIIDHGEGYLSLYAHNQLLLKETGDWVKPGEVIAKTGATGGLSRSALYFEIRLRGQPLDPKPWLKPRG